MSTSITFVSSVVPKYGTQVYLYWLGVGGLTSLRGLTGETSGNVPSHLLLKGFGCESRDSGGTLTLRNWYALPSLLSPVEVCMIVHNSVRIVVGLKLTATPRGPAATCHPSGVQ